MKRFPNQDIPDDLTPLFRVSAKVGPKSVEFLADRNGWMSADFDPFDARYYTEGSMNDDSSAYLQELFVNHEAEWLAAWLRESYPGIVDVEITPEDLPISGYYAMIDPGDFHVYRGDAPNGLPYGIVAKILPQPDDQDPDETHMREFFARRRSLPRGWKVLDQDPEVKP